MSLGLLSLLPTVLLFILFKTNLANLQRNHVVVFVLTTLVDMITSTSAAHEKPPPPADSASQWGSLDPLTIDCAPTSPLQLAMNPPTRPQ